MNVHKKQGLRRQPEGRKSESEESGNPLQKPAEPQ